MKRYVAQLPAPSLQNFWTFISKLGVCTRAKMVGNHPSLPPLFFCDRDLGRHSNPPRGVLGPFTFSREEKSIHHRGNPPFLLFPGLSLWCIPFFPDLPKGRFRTKNSTALESVFCFRRSCSLSVAFSCLFRLENQAFLSPLRRVLRRPYRIFSPYRIHSHSIFSTGGSLGPRYGVYPLPLFFPGNGIHHGFFCSVTSGSGDRPRKEGCHGGGVYSFFPGFRPKVGNGVENEFPGPWGPQT